MAATLREQVDALRKEAGLRPMRWSEDLDALAQREAESLARGRDGGLDEASRRKLAQLGHSGVDRHTVKTNDFAGFRDLRLWTQAAATAAGIGVARSREDELVLVVLLAS